MKKIYSILSALLFAVVLLVGLWSLFDKDATYSDREKRPLKTKPAFSLTALLDGTYFSNYSAYFADTFPNREVLMEANSVLNGFYRFSGGQGSIIINPNSGAGNHGEALPGKETEHLNDDGTTAGTTDGSEPEDTMDSGPIDPGAAEQLGAILLMEDQKRALEVPYCSESYIQRYAQAVNRIAEALGDDVRTFNVLVPNAAEFYSPAEYHTGSSSQANMFEICQNALSDKVSYVDAYSVLAQHTQEYLYFRTDHHWTHLGAYYAYTAFCDEAGFTAADKDTFETGQWDNFVGSLYTSAADYPQSKILKDNPDTVFYYKTKVECKTYVYSDATLSDPYPMGTVCYIEEDVSNKYLTFLGGDHPITIVDTGKEGKVCMILKESYGNAFTPWLINNYSKVIAIDPREFNRSGAPSLDLAAFAEEQGVDDCIILDYPMVLGSDAYISWLERMVDSGTE